MAAETLTENTIRLKWNEVSEAVSYRVYSDNGALLSVLNSNTFQHNRTGLNLGTIYSYRVSAVTSGRESVKSAVSARTWEQLVFNRLVNGAVWAQNNTAVSHYFRFYAAEGVHLIFNTFANKYIDVKWEDNNERWFTHNSTSSEQTSPRTGWAYFYLNDIGGYTLQIKKSEAIVSYFSFTGISVTGEGLNEIEKTVMEKK